MAYQTINPATGEVVRTFAECTDGEIEAAVQQAQAVYERDWRCRSVADRARNVSGAAAKLRQHAEEHPGYLTLEMGKLIGEARGEVSLAADILDYYAERAETYLKPQPIAEAPGNIVETLPLGIILGVEPWNFPDYQLARVRGGIVNLGGGFPIVLNGEVLGAIGVGSGTTEQDIAVAEAGRDAVLSGLAASQ